MHALAIGGENTRLCLLEWAIDAAASAEVVVGEGNV